MFSFPALSLRQTCLFSSQLFPSIVASVSTCKKNYHALGREERIEIRVDSSEIIPASTSVRAAFLLDGQLGAFWGKLAISKSSYLSREKAFNIFPGTQYRLHNLLYWLVVNCIIARTLT